MEGKNYLQVGKGMDGSTEKVKIFSKGGQDRPHWSKISNSLV